MKICYLTHDALNEGIGQSQIVPLLNLLNRAGHAVTVISCEKQVSSKASVNLDKEVDWVALKFGKRGPIAGALRVLRISVKIPRADVYHARGDLVALSLVLRGRRPFLWDVRGLWVDQKMVIGSLPKSKLIQRLGLKIEAIAANRSDAVTTLTKRVMVPLRKRQPSLPSVWEVIPTCVDLKRFTQSEKIANKRKVLLSGVFNQYYDLKLTEKVLNIFETNGFEIDWHRGKESITPRLDVAGMKVYESKYVDMPEIIAGSSLGVAICKSDIGESLKGVMPTKVAEFFSVGRPVLVSAGIGDLDEMIRIYNVGWIVEDFTELEDLVASVKTLLDDTELPKRCREVAEKYFDMTKAAEIYEVIYEKISKS